MVRNELRIRPFEFPSNVQSIAPADPKSQRENSKAAIFRKIEKSGNPPGSAAVGGAPGSAAMGVAPSIFFEKWLHSQFYSAETRFTSFLFKLLLNVSRVLSTCMYILANKKVIQDFG